LDVDRKPDVYEFESLVFGEASAPYFAQYVSQENARICQEEFLLAAGESSDSVRDNDAAIHLVQELQELWATEGVKARKWLTFSTKVLAVIPKEL